MSRLVCMAPPKQRGSLTREDWLNAALEALEESGVGGIKVLSVAKRLGASRGSFYWHFQDQRDLLQSVLEYWDRWSTDTVIAAYDLPGDVEPVQAGQMLDRHFVEPQPIAGERGAHVGKDGHPEGP